MGHLGARAGPPVRLDQGDDHGRHAVPQRRQRHPAHGGDDRRRQPGGRLAARSLDEHRRAATPTPCCFPTARRPTVGGGVGTGAQGLYTFQDEQRQIELFDPVSGSWRLGPAQAEGRAYHSTAALLPDGRVISAGDNYNGTIGQPGGDRSDTAEIYSPPYLFKGARPAIGGAPQSVAWGDTFGIHSPDSVSRAVLMAPAATTHGYDMNQRHVELQVTNTVAGTGIDVVSPPNSKVAPPGYYMLFLLNGQGVPSVASWVRIDGSAPDRRSDRRRPAPAHPDRHPADGHGHGQRSPAPASTAPATAPSPIPTARRWPSPPTPPAAPRSPAGAATARAPGPAT